MRLLTHAIALFRCACCRPTGSPVADQVLDHPNTDAGVLAPVLGDKREVSMIWGPAVALVDVLCALHALAAAAAPDEIALDGVRA
jgi:hypothetical protein